MNNNSCVFLLLLFVPVNGMFNLYFPVFMKPNVKQYFSMSFVTKIFSISIQIDHFSYYESRIKLLHNSTGLFSSIQL